MKEKKTLLILDDDGYKTYYLVDRELLVSAGMYAHQLANEWYDNLEEYEDEYESQYMFIKKMLENKYNAVELDSAEISI